MEHLIVAEDRIAGELGDARDQELEDVLILVEREVVAEEAGLQHVQVGREGK